ncbi:MAG: hypothetical protein KKA73_16540 [Chloroflexi bacterium]|nr:hypothetical protein [Chloroflexota bacterium]
MRRNMPDFRAKASADQARLGQAGALDLLDAGRAWDLAPALRAGGSVIFPHASLEACGHQIAAAVHAGLDSGAARVLVLGVLHAQTPELAEARERVAHGGAVAQEPTWGIQGPGLAGRADWRAEFSLANFRFLWEQETQRRGSAGPELVIRYPYLVEGRPDRLPGIGELQEIARDAAVLVTTDPFHHGIGYGEPPETALAPEQGGLELARRQIATGLDLLRGGDYAGYHQHCVAARSDGRDVGPVLRYLLGPVDGRILDLIADDMAAMYQQPAPTWVAGALIELQPVEPR